MLTQDAIIKIVASSVEIQLATAVTPLVVGISGAQGSGKTTLAAELAAYYRGRGLTTAVLSIDDLYLGWDARQELGKRVHPLLATRGVPGTHDMRLGLAILARLDAKKGAMLPRFDKSIDDRLSFDRWDWAPPETRVLILEGWCLGAEPVNDRSLRKTSNELEKREDRKRKWRRYVNTQLAGDYQQFFGRIDLLLFLKAPNFETVRRWRCEQERHLRTVSGGGMSNAELARFMRHYERITEQMLSSLPRSENITVVLDSQRQPTDMLFNEPLAVARSKQSTAGPFVDGLSSLKEIFEIYRKYVEHQYSLINNRTTWFVQSQSFLAAVYLGIVTGVIGPHPDKNPEVADWAGIAICILGIALAMIFSLLLKAASDPVFDLFDRWQFLRQYSAQRSRHAIPFPLSRVPENCEADLTNVFPFLTGGFNARHARSGIFYTKLLPWTFGLFWASFLALTIWGMIQSGSFRLPGQRAQMEYVKVEIGIPEPAHPRTQK